MLSNKYKELFKNMSFLTISSFGCKILSFLLVPLYTSILTTEEYGIFDNIKVLVELLIPILTFNISEAIVVFFIDRKHKSNDIINIIVKYIIIGILGMVILVTINYCFDIISIFNEYVCFLLIYYISLMLYQIVQGLARGLDMMKKLAISGIINTVILLNLNIVFLVILKYGINGYFLSCVISNFLTTIYLIISLNLKKYVKKDKINKELEKQMISYGRPLIFNSIGWWITNVSDRYIVTYMCGLSENGIYSVAYKIPSILTIFQSIFNQVWTISAIKTYDKDDKDNFFSNIYTMYNICMVVTCSFVIILTKFLAGILYKNEFFMAWKYAPLLMVSIVFGALSGMFGGVFAAVKDSKIVSISTIAGAIINIFLNIILVAQYGAMGAAISTVISYFIVWIIRYIYAKKYITLRNRLFKDIFVYILLIVQVIIIELSIVNIYIIYILEIIILLIIGLIYIKEIGKILLKIKNNIFKKGERYGE